MSDGRSAQMAPNLETLLVGSIIQQGLGRLVTTTPIIIDGKRTHVQLYYPKSPNPDIQDVVEVTGLTKDMAKEPLMLHFENTRRSGGGEVLDMNVDYNSNTAQIRFKDKQDAYRVVCKYRHVVDGVEIRVTYPEHPDKLIPGKMVTSVDRKEKVTTRESGYTDRCWTYGVCSLPDGGWLVTDVLEKALKRLGTNGSVIDCFHMGGSGFWCLYDVCFVKENKVAAVPMGKDSKIELISLGEERMTRMRTIQTRHECAGVTYTNKKLFVTSGTSGCPEIYEYDYSDGRLLRVISPRNLHKRIIGFRTGYISCSEDGSRLFVSDRYKTVLTMDTITGDVIQQVSVDAESHSGVCLGEDDELFVAARHAVIRFDRNGTNLGTVITEEMMDGRGPLCISYDKRTARLAVTLFGRGCDYMCVFHMKQ